MAATRDKAKEDDSSLLWLVAGAAGVYFLMKQEDGLQLPDISNWLDLGNLVPDITWPWEQEGLTWPWSGLSEGMQGMFGMGGDKAVGIEGVGGEGEGDIGFLTPLIMGGARATAVGGRYFVARKLARSTVLRGAAKTAGELTARQLVKASESSILRTGVKRVPILKNAYPTALRIERIIAPRAGVVGGVKTATKVATRVSAKTGAKVASALGTRLIPGLGWLMLAVDVGADIARIFGADVNEWIGISPIFSGAGENPLERMARERK